MMCKTCRSACLSTLNGECPICAEQSRAAWQAKMDIRQDPAQFDMRRLVNILLTQHWMHECVIIPAWMPPHPSANTRPSCVVEFTYKGGEKTFLRHSKGPLQGHDWDSYGDDYQCPELALVALSQAPPPPRIDYCIPTHGK